MENGLKKKTEKQKLQCS